MEPASAEGTTDQQTTEQGKSTVTTARTGPSTAGGPGSTGRGSSGPESARGTRPAAAAAAVGWLSVTSVVAAALMAIGHAGVTIPLVSAIGPGGGRPVWPAAVVFAVGALVFTALATGAFRAARWTWPAALVVNALAALSMVRPFRGLGSVLGLVLFGATLLVLASPAGRRAFRR